MREGSGVDEHSMESNRKTRVAVIGCGPIAHRAYLPFLVGRNDVEIVAVWSRTEKGLLSVSSRYPVQNCFTDFYKVLDQNADCAFVLTPCETHAQFTIPLLEAGADVLCEKPMAWTLRESERMVETSLNTGRLLMIGFNRRYSPLCARVKQFFEGTPVEICLAERGKAKGRPRCVTEDIVHNLDLLRWYCGEPVKVSAHTTGVGSVGTPTAAGVNDTRPFSIDPRAGDTYETSLVAMVQFDSGAVGLATVSFSSGRWYERVSVSGGGRTAFIEAPDMLRLSQAGRDESGVSLTGSLDSWATPAEMKGFRAQIEEFINCHRTGKRPLTVAEDAFKSMALLDHVCHAAGIQPLE